MLGPASASGCASSMSRLSWVGSRPRNRRDGAWRSSSRSPGPGSKSMRSSVPSAPLAGQRTRVPRRTLVSNAPSLASSGLAILALRGLLRLLHLEHDALVEADAQRVAQHLERAHDLGIVGAREQDQ